MSYLPYIHLYTHNLLHYYKAGDQASSVELLVNCKTVGFFSQISKEIGKAWRTESHAREAREEKNCLSPVSLSVVFGLVPDLLFDCSPVLSLPTDVLWGSFVTHSFLPHGMNA